MYGDAITRSITAMMVFLLAAGAGIGALAVWGIPILWNWVKPWLHGVTT